VSISHKIRKSKREKYTPELLSDVSWKEYGDNLISNYRFNQCHHCRTNTLIIWCVNKHEAPISHHRYCEECLEEDFDEDPDEARKDPNYECVYCRKLTTCDCESVNCKAVRDDDPSTRKGGFPKRKETPVKKN